MEANEWSEQQFKDVLRQMGADLDEKAENYMAHQGSKNNTGTLLEEFLKFSDVVKKRFDDGVSLKKSSKSPNPVYGKFCHYVYHSRVGYEIGEKGNQKVHRSYIVTQDQKSNAIEAVIDDMNEDFINEGKDFWYEVSQEWKNFLADHDEDVTVDDALETLDDAIDEIDQILTQKDE